MVTETLNELKSQEIFVLVQLESGLRNVSPSEFDDVTPAIPGMPLIHGPLCRIIWYELFDILTVRTKLLDKTSYFT